MFMFFEKHARLIAGIVALIVGIICTIVPLIPVLGVAGLFAGAFLLSPYVPILDRFKEWLKKKDSSGHTEKTEEILEEFEEKLAQPDSKEEQGSSVSDDAKKSR